MHRPLRKSLGVLLGLGTVVATLTVGAGSAQADPVADVDPGPVSLDPVTEMVGLDSHDHPWPERPPPILDLGQTLPVS